MSATDEAARRFPNDMGHGSTNGPGALTSASFPIKLRRGDFAAGAAWQRSQPVEVTDAMVEAAAKEMARLYLPDSHTLDDRIYAVEQWRRYSYEASRIVTAALNTMKEPNQ